MVIKKYINSHGRIIEWDSDKSDKLFHVWKPLENTDIISDDKIIDEVIDEVNNESLEDEKQVFNSLKTLKSVADTNRPAYTKAGIEYIFIDEKWVKN